MFISFKGLQNLLNKSKFLTPLKVVIFESWDLNSENVYKLEFVGNKAKGWILKRLLQENKETNISYPLRVHDELKKSLLPTIVVDEFGIVVCNEILTFTV